MRKEAADAHGTKQEAQQSPRAGAQEHKDKNNALIIEAHQNYLAVAQQYLCKAQDTLAMLATHKKQGFRSPLDLARKDSSCIVRHEAFYLDLCIRPPAVCTPVHAATISCDFIRLSFDSPIG